MTCNAGCNTEPLTENKYQCCQCGAVVRVDAPAGDGLISSSASAIDTGRRQRI